MMAILHQVTVAYICSSETTAGFELGYPAVYYRHTLDHTLNRYLTRTW